MPLKRVYIIILFTILLSPLGGVGGGSLYAQTSGQGTISGILKQDDGMPVIGARIFVFNLDAYGDEHIVGSANTADDNDNQGKYMTEKIPVGIYTVTIKYPSYKKVIITNVPVLKDSSTHINMKLEMQSPESAEEITLPYASFLPKPPVPLPVTDTTKKEEKKKKRR